MTFLGVTCTFETSGTDIGTLTGSGSTGGAATIELSATIPEVSHNFGCPSSEIYSGSYKATGGNANFQVAEGSVSSSPGAVLCKTTPASGEDCGEAWQVGVGAELDLSINETVRWKTSRGTTIATCTEGTSKGSIANAGSTTEAVLSNSSELIWGGCTTSVHTLENGSVAVHHIAGSDNGTVISNGEAVTITFLGVTCTFKTSSTDIGTLTGGTAAVVDVTGTISEISGNFGCPSTASWSGSLKVTVPAGTLHVAAG